MALVDLTGVINIGVITWLLLACHASIKHLLPDQPSLGASTPRSGDGTASGAQSSHVASASSVQEVADLLAHEPQAHAVPMRNFLGTLASIGKVRFADHNPVIRCMVLSVIQYSAPCKHLSRELSCQSSRFFFRSMILSLIGGSASCRADVGSVRACGACCSAAPCIWCQTRNQHMLNARDMRINTCCRHSVKPLAC
jgi:hypothetical protein